MSMSHSVSIPPGILKLLPTNLYQHRLYYRFQSNTFQLNQLFLKSKNIWYTFRLFPSFWDRVEPSPLLLRLLLAYCTSSGWWRMKTSVEQSMKKPKYSEKTCPSAELLVLRLMVLQITEQKGWCLYISTLVYLTIKTGLLNPSEDFQGLLFSIITEQSLSYLNL
jgi:hypothetical protein